MTETDLSPRDVERGLLGIGLTGGDIDTLATMVTPADFYAPVSEQVWLSIVRVHEAGTGVDAVTVRDDLTRSAPNLKLDPMELLDLVRDAPSVANGPWYAERVIEAATRRRIVAAGTKVRQIGESTALSVDEAREQARDAVDAATQGRASSELVAMPEVLASVIEVAEHGATKTLSTPWPDIDRLITGLAPGRLVVVGARPGVGKSVMGTNLALHFAERHQHAVLVASMEMSALEVGQRLVASRARVDLRALMAGDLSSREWDLIKAHGAAINALPIYTHDSATQTVTSIRSGAREIQRLRPDLSLVVVDYLQLLKSGAKASNRAEEIGHMSRGLKVLARETNTCVVAMAQVNREGVKNTDGRPRLTDLRESGSIEADADQVILLHRPDDENPEIHANVAKNRHGPIGVATLMMAGHYATLSSATRADPSWGGAA